MKRLKKQKFKIEDEEPILWRKALKEMRSGNMKLASVFADMKAELEILRNDGFIYAEIDSKANITGVK